jgi:pimeloyl-ACP methyl ester carboxylesterase
MAPLALAYQPCGTFNILSFDQSTRFWYQWFLCTDGGAAALRKDPIGFARIQWATWSPRGWFDDAEFERTAENFFHPDWARITLNAYCERWRQGEAWDSRYDGLQNQLRETENVRTPALMIQGLSDNCDPPGESEGLEGFFTGGYRRVLLENVGHFPHREAPSLVAEAILDHFRQNIT